MMYSCASLTEAEQLTDIGCVVYVKNPDGSGNLIADWAYSLDATNTIVGTGCTTQSPNSLGFAGEYKIYYTGTKKDSYNLIISQNKSIDSSTFFKVLWKDINTGKIDFYGTGVVKDSQLIVGWRK